MSFTAADQSEKVFRRHRYLANKAHQRRGYLKRAYDLSPEEYDKLLAAQGGACAICRKPPAQKRLAVDHDHKTGKVRGLLCMSCNTKLGWYERFLEHILQYLLRKDSFS